jgi:hypothetical protein
VERAAERYKADFKKWRAKGRSPLRSVCLSFSSLYIYMLTNVFIIFKFYLKHEEGWVGQRQQKTPGMSLPFIYIYMLTSDIYLGINIISGEEVAIKLESVKAKHPQREYESKVYKTLAGGVGVLFVRWIRYRMQLQCYVRVLFLRVFLFYWCVISCRPPLAANTKNWAQTTRCTFFSFAFFDTSNFFYFVSRFY